jgi:hypothetical protein
MIMRMAHTVRRLVVVAIAVVAIAGAVAWVSATFTDRSFACGTAFGEARHGEVLPAVLVGSKPPPPGPLLVGPPGTTVTLCRGQARARLVESGGMILLALLAVGFSLRPRRKEPPEIAVM